MGYLRSFGGAVGRRSFRLVGWRFVGRLFGGGWGGRSLAVRRWGQLFVGSVVWSFGGVVGRQPFGGAVFGRSFGGVRRSVGFGRSSGGVVGRRPLGGVVGYRSFGGVVDRRSFGGVVGGRSFVGRSVVRSSFGGKRPSKFGCLDLSTVSIKIYEQNMQPKSRALECIAMMWRCESLIVL